MTLAEREHYRRAVEQLTAEELQAEYSRQACLVKKTIIEIEAVKRRLHLRKESN